MNKKDVCECVLEVVRNISEIDDITSETHTDDVMLDSIGWMRCLVAIEKKLGCAIDPKVFFSSCNTSIGALCDSLLKYFNII